MNSRKLEEISEDQLVKIGHFSDEYRIREKLYKYIHYDFI